jgi:ketosteroid isomerase-like protein
VSEENIELVRGISERWSRGDFSAVDWADPEIEFRTPEFMASRTVHGIEAMGREWAAWLQTFEPGFRSEAFEFIDAGDQVVTFNRFTGRGRASGLPIREIPGAARFLLRGGKVVELQIYNDHKEALRDAGLEPEAEGL